MFDQPSSSLFGEDEGVRVLEELIAKARGLADQDLAALPSSACKKRAVLLSKLGSIVQVLQGDSMVELDRLGVTDAEDGFRTPDWVAHVTQTPKLAARHRLNVATCLNQNFPMIRTAILAGELSWDHAVALHKASNVRNVDRMSSVQETLIEITGYCNSYETWAQNVAALGKRADDDGPSTHAQVCANNTLRFIDQFNGTHRFEGQLANEYVEIVKQAIGRESQSLFNKYSADATVDPGLGIPALPTLQALALVDIVRRSNGAPDAPFRPIADITLVVKAEGNELKTDQVDKITADILTCDPVFRPIVINSLGTPLAAGRSVRLATNVQRRALAVRDGGCVFPGCTANDTHCEAHHVIHYRNGGRTDLNNLALLCHHHHSVTHRNSWHMQAVDDVGNFKWTTPTGREINSQRHGRRTPTSPTSDQQHTG
jgi:hypothetical protein